MGIVGSLIIAKWAIGLMKETSGILLDGSLDPEISELIKTTVEAEPDCRVTDLHAWAVAPEHLAVILSVETSSPKTPDEIKALLSDIPHLIHINVEVHST